MRDKLTSWLTIETQQEIRDVFEPRYKRKLSKTEVVEIAENITGAMERILKFKCIRYGELPHATS